MTQTLSKHVIIDFYSCYEQPLSTEDTLCEILASAFATLNIEIPEVTCATFNSDIVIYAVSEEFHLTLRTYPECGYAALDMYIFEDSVNAVHIMKELKKSFGTERVKMTSVNRGDFGKSVDMKPRSKTRTTTKAKVKRTGKQFKSAGSKALRIITRKNKK